MAPRAPECYITGRSLSLQASSFRTPTSCRRSLSWATAWTMASLTSCRSSRTARTSSCNQFMCRTYNKYPRSHKMRQRRYPARQHAAALAHAGDADKVGPEVSAAMRLLALPVEDRRHVPVVMMPCARGRRIRTGLFRSQQPERLDPALGCIDRC